ncbi:MAG TPA: amidohydrolase family protein [Steroidobacteraceae bacterium]|jgi:hypothetical protein|nr:amidohydrolase family protein [Steroidobacteraceae bacterium]
MLLEFAAALGLITAVSSSQYSAVTGATLIDVSAHGHAESDLSDAVILIADGRIVAVGDRAHVRLPRHTTIIDAAGRYVIPGLIDGFGAVRTPGFADAYLYEGVTTVVVPLAPDPSVDGETKVIAPTNGLSVLTSVPISGYSDNGSIPTVSPWREHRLKDRRLEASVLAAQVEAAAAGGHRVIAAGLDVWPDQLDIIIAQAHRLGLAVTGEMAFTSYPYAINAGLDVFVRNDKYSLNLSQPQDFLAYADDPRGRGGMAAARAVCGTAPREALAAATGNPAESFRLPDRGQLEAGRRADLVILDADPRVDIAAVDAIREVMVDGKRVDRARLLDAATARRRAQANTG